MSVVLDGGFWSGIISVISSAVAFIGALTVGHTKLKRVVNDVKELETKYDKKAIADAEHQGKMETCLKRIEKMDNKIDRLLERP